MKKLASAFLLFVLAASMAVGSATSFGGDAAMNAFWEKFKNRSNSGDRDAVFEMSTLPTAMVDHQPNSNRNRM